MPRSSLLLLLAAFLVSTSGCGLLQGGADTDAAPGGPLEKPRIKVAVLPTVETVLLQTATDVAGKKVAVTAKGTLADLMVKSAMATQNVDHTKIQFVEMPFPDMPTALDRGLVDAAMLVEPFVTAAERAVGAIPLLDLATGPLNDLPFTLLKPPPPRPSAPRTK
jgi:NitT/TauT family transport system substrate-binding protein